MSKYAVVYWSGTGNTEKMAFAVAEGIRAKGAEVGIFHAAEFNPSQTGDYAGIAFGCPSMGAGELEADEFEAVYGAAMPRLSGEPVALFGSYGWGDGEWMRNWQEEVEQASCNLIAEGLIANNEPDEDALAACRALGEKLAG